MDVNKEASSPRGREVVTALFASCGAQWAQEFPGDLSQGREPPSQRRVTIKSLRHLPDCVLRAKGVWHTQSALRIVPPLAVHQEAIAMRTGFEINGETPNAFVVFSHIKRILCPMREIANELYFTRVGSGEGKDFVKAVVCDFHKFLSRLMQKGENETPL